MLGKMLITNYAHLKWKIMNIMPLIFNALMKQLLCVNRIYWSSKLPYNLFAIPCLKYYIYSIYVYIYTLDGNLFGLQIISP